MVTIVKTFKEYVKYLNYTSLQTEIKHDFSNQRLRYQPSNAYQHGIAQNDSIRFKKNTNKYGYLIY